MRLGKACRPDQFAMSRVVRCKLGQGWPATCAGEVSVGVIVQPYVLAEPVPHRGDSLPHLSLGARPCRGHANIRDHIAHGLRVVLEVLKEIIVVRRVGVSADSNPEIPSEQIRDRTLVFGLHGLHLGGRLPPPRQRKLWHLGLQMPISVLDDGPFFHPGSPLGPDRFLRLLVRGCDASRRRGLAGLASLASLLLLRHGTTSCVVVH